MKYAENVKDFLLKTANELASKFISEIDEELSEPTQWMENYIESPIEQLFLIAWRGREFCHGKYPFDLEGQYCSNLSTDKYIIDFIVEFGPDAYCSFPKDIFFQIPAPLLGVELDGHEWHEKTKRQVEHHKMRERFLIEKGWKILRFSGSEIFKDPFKCVDEVLFISWDERRKYYNALESVKEKILGKSPNVK